MNEGSGIESGAVSNDVSKVKNQNEQLISNIADLTAEKITVGKPGETVTERALSMEPNNVGLEQAKEDIRESIGKQQNMYESGFLAQNKAVEISNAIQDSEEKKQSLIGTFQKEKDLQNTAFVNKSKRDIEKTVAATGQIGTAKQEVKEGLAKSEKLSRLGGEIDSSKSLTQENLEVLENPVLTETLLKSLNDLETAKNDLQQEIKQKEAKLAKVEVQRNLINSYGKILSSLQNVKIFGIDKLARRAAIRATIPSVENDGKEYRAQREVQSYSGSVEENLQEVRDSLEDAIISNQEELDRAEENLGKTRAQASLKNLVSNLIKNQQARKNAISLTKAQMTKNIEAEERGLDEQISGISSKSMEDYQPGYNEFARKTADSTVAAKSQEFSIPHQQAVLGSNAANLFGQEARTVAENANEINKTDRVQSDISSVIERINSERAKVGIAPMTAEEQQSQVDRLLGK